MKKVLTVITIIAITLFGCKKQAGKESASKMNGIEFTKKYGIELPYLDYGNGLTVARGKKAKAEAVTLTVTDGDLVLSFVSGNTYHSTTSVNAEWAAFQNLTDTLSYQGCNFNWTNVSAPDGIDCSLLPSGVTARTFTSDKSTSATAYDIHLSNLLITQ